VTTGVPNTEGAMALDAIKVTVPALRPLIWFPGSRAATVLEGKVHLMSCLASTGRTDAFRATEAPPTVNDSGDALLITTEAGNTVGAFVTVITKVAVTEGASL